MTGLDPFQGSHALLTQGNSSLVGTRFSKNLSQKAVFGYPIWPTYIQDRSINSFEIQLIKIPGNKQNALSFEL